MVRWQGDAAAEPPIRPSIAERFFSSVHRSLLRGGCEITIVYIVVVLVLRKLRGAPPPPLRGFEVLPAKKEGGTQ